MARPKLVFFGFSMAGAEVLRQLLLDGANVAAVYTYEDNPSENWFESVKKIAVENKIPVFTPEKIERADIENIAKIKPEIILSVYYRSLLPDEVLKLAPRGAYNIHGSYLPKYRGRAPVNWVLVNGEKYTGATLHYMTAKADAGDIVDQEKVEIKFEDNALTLTKKVSAAARRIIKYSLKKLENGPAAGKPQDMSESTYFGRRTPEDGQINWEWDALKIYNLIRAVTKPFPGAFTYLPDGRKMLIWKAKILDGNAAASFGGFGWKNWDIKQDVPFIMKTGTKDLQILDYEIVKGD
ncbi:MAG: formyltransferase [Elusimicrobia bacterium]|nr:formyltransferase [Elusimicrobiota bacterium]